MPATPGMKGAGFYDQHSSGQAASIQILLDWIAAAGATLPLPPELKPIVVLDLGSSEGRNALLVMQTTVAAIRQRRDAQPVQTVYSDLPGNNFNRLFATLHEAQSAGRLAAGVYPSATAGSFYGPLLPPGSVHFATCFNALLWLDQLPAVPIPDFVVYRRSHPPRPGLSAPPEVVTTFTRQAEHDLLCFLTSRAEELVPGGKLLLANPADDDRYRCSDGLYDLLNDACRDLVEAGRLERTRYERLVVPVYFRTAAETLEPLEWADSPVRGAFSVDRIETLEVPTPFIVEFQRTGDVPTYAERYTGFLRAFTEPVVQAVLTGPNGDPGLIDTLFERVRARLLAEPGRYQFHYLLVAALLTRR